MKKHALKLHFLFTKLGNIFETVCKKLVISTHSSFKMCNIIVIEENISIL